MTRTWKFLETLAMHLVSALILLAIGLWAIGAVQAHPSNSSCHKHGAVVHCK